MLYLEAIEIQALHWKIIEETGGSHGVRDSSLIHSAAERPKASFGGKYMYPETHAKAAALYHSLVMNHAFVDGNKRTSIIATARFLYINGHIFSASNRDAVDFTLRIVADKLDTPEIAEWLSKNTRES